MNIPIDIIWIFFAMTIGLIGVGYIARFTIPMSLFFFIAGGLLAVLFIMTDNITLGNIESGKTISGNEELEHYNVNASSAQTAIGGTTKIVGEFVSNSSSELYLDNIDCITVILGEALGQTATGNSIIGVFYNDTTTLRKQFGTIDNTLLLNNIRQLYTFCLPFGDTYQIQELDNIGVFFNDSSPSIAEVNVFSDGELFDGTITHRRFISATGFSDSPNNDLSALMSQRGLVFEDNTIVPNNYPFTQEIKTFMVLISAIIMLIGGAIEIQQRK